MSFSDAARIKPNYLHSAGPVPRFTGDSRGRGIKCSNGAGMGDQCNSWVPRGFGREALATSRISSCRPTSLSSQTVPMSADIAAAAGAAAMSTTEAVATAKAQAANMAADEDFGTFTDHMTKSDLPPARGAQETGCPALHAYDSGYTGSSVTECSAPATTAVLSSEGKPSSVSASYRDCHGGDNGVRLASAHSFRLPSSSRQIDKTLPAASPLSTKNSNFPLDSAHSFVSELAATNSAPEAAAFRLDAGGNAPESSNSARAENFEAPVRVGGYRENGTAPTARNSLCSCSMTTKDFIRMRRRSPSSAPPHMTEPKKHKTIKQGQNQEKSRLQEDQTSGKIRTISDTPAASTKRTGQHCSLEGLRLNCDYCVKKKVKCSRGIPCSACNRKGLICEFSYKQKPGPKVRRVSIPSTEDCHGGRDQRAGMRVLDPSQIQHSRQKFQRKVEQQGYDHTDKGQERLRLQHHAHGGAALTVDYLPHQGLRGHFDPQNRFEGGFYEAIRHSSGLTETSLDLEFRPDPSSASTPGDVCGGGSGGNGLRGGGGGEEKSRGRGYFEPAVPAPVFSYPRFPLSYEEANRPGKAPIGHRGFSAATATVVTEAEISFGNAETSVLTFVPQPSFPQGDVRMTENFHSMLPPSAASHRLNEIHGTSSLIDIADDSREEVDNGGEDFHRVGGYRRIGDARINSGAESSNNRAGSSGRKCRNYSGRNCNNCSSSGVDADVIGGNVRGAISTTSRGPEPNPELLSPHQQHSMHHYQIFLSEQQPQSYAAQSTFEDAWSAKALLSMRRL